MDEFYKRFGTILQNRRKELKLTQDVVAESIGVSRVTLASLESGEHRLLLHHTFELIALLDIDLDEVFALYRKEKLKTEISHQEKKDKDVLEKTTERPQENNE
jgi:transcriptional regulator with XRE-family HTH domain